MHFIFLFAAVALASTPSQHRRFHRKRIDLDNNGIPDWCYGDESSITHCLESGNGYTEKDFAITVTTVVVMKTITRTVTADDTLPTPASSTPSTTTSSVIPASAATPHGAPTSPANRVAANLAMPADESSWASAKGTKWTLSNLGTLYSSSIPSLGWDKGRTSTLANTTFWNFGDVLSNTNGFANGMSMGAAFYASTTDFLEVDMKDITNVTPWDFAKPWVGDKAPEGKTDLWGMDTSNVAEVTPGVGIGFVWEIWRSSDPAAAVVDRGSGMVNVTLGSKVPIATRTGPLITGPDSVQVGMLTIFRAEGYIYLYSNIPAGTAIVVGRVSVFSAFDTSTYEYRKPLTGEWVRGIPDVKDTSYHDGTIHADGQGSMMYNNYLGRYVLFVGAYGGCINFYTSETPYGPWSKVYTIVESDGYGVNVHPHMDVKGEGKTIYVSSGNHNVIDLWKVEIKL